MSVIGNLRRRDEELASGYIVIRCSKKQAGLEFQPQREAARDYCTAELSESPRRPTGAGRAGIGGWGGQIESPWG